MLQSERMHILINMNRSIKKINYTLEPHTADICIKLGGTTLKKLFDNAAKAVTDQMVSAGKKGQKIMNDIAIIAPDKDLLFIYWLQEVLYQFYVHGLMYAGSKIKSLSNTTIKAEVAFIRFDPKEHDAKREIKAVTYHDVHIEKKGGIYSVRFVVDI